MGEIMIENYTFGSFMIDGRQYEYDIKIKGEEVIPWQYIKHHTVTLGDIRELLEDKPEILVIGTGSSGLVNVEGDALQQAESQGTQCIVKPTGEACEDYNKALREKKKVVAIMHATC